MTNKHPYAFLYDKVNALEKQNKKLIAALENLFGERVYKYQEDAAKKLLTEITGKKYD